MAKIADELSGLAPTEARARLMELWAGARAHGAMDIVEFALDKLERVNYTRCLAARDREGMIQGVLALRAIQELREFLAELERGYTEETGKP